MKQSSVRISAAFVLLFAAALVALLFTAPLLVDLYSTVRKLPQVVFDCILYTFYLCTIPAAIALYSLLRLLLNISHEQIFILQNSRFLACISWCALAVFFVTLAACCHYLPLGLVAVAMLFIFLILRVVRSCMLAGTELKDENSLTI